MFRNFSFEKEQYGVHYNKEQNSKEHFMLNALCTNGFVLYFYWSFIVFRETTVKNVHYSLENVWKEMSLTKARLGLC